MKQLTFLLEALHHLHTETFIYEKDVAKGIVHGDIKPKNILINKQGNCRLTDFDCAYAANKPAHQFGSLRYMAPELFANKNFTKTPIMHVNKSDIWSLGITLFRLLNNKFPIFFNDFSSEANAHLFEEKLDKNNYCAIKDNISIFIDLEK